MKSSLFYFFRIWIALISLLGLTAVSQGAVTDLGKIERDSSVIVRPIYISAKQGEVQALLEKALDMHGSLKVTTTSNAAAFLIEANKISNNQIQINIFSNNPKQLVISQTINGRNELQSILKASDFVVEKILGTRGFYSGKIAFIGERRPNYRDVYVGDLLFYQVEAITHDNQHALNPSFSPDGRHILYTTYFKSGSPDIFKINLDTRQRTPFAMYDGVNMCPSYSPIGNKVAMVLSSKKEPKLYISDPSGANPRKVSFGKSAETSPAWSPDGSQIILASDAPGAPQLFIYDIRQSKPAPKRLPIGISSYCVEPSWNPVHANLIAFTYRSSQGFQIGLYDLNTHQSKSLTQGPYEGLEPCWLSDGRHLIYTQRNGYKMKLHILDSLSGKTTPLHSEKFGRTSQADFVSL